ncbi:hypothetical protein C360_02050 [Cryptococcus neoformans Bt15]|nr:hypothetical protein C360_02050 [Cryptococcus neoformans var. grubii Bt15]
MSYPPTATCQNRTQPTIDAPVVAKQPISQRVMDIRNAGSKESIQEKSRMKKL